MCCAALHCIQVGMEADWPQLGFATGFRNSSMPRLVTGNTDSLYLRLRARNRCNHRDYHNLASQYPFSDLITKFKVVEF